jgi:hypothetical protein
MEDQAVRFIVATLAAMLIGLGFGYVWWGGKVADLSYQLEEERIEFASRLDAAERRVKAAEDRAQRETDARIVMENELHKLRPLK